MKTILRDWTIEKAMLHASEPVTALAAQRIALTDHWHNIGHDHYSLWGEYQSTDDTNAYQVKIDLFKLLHEDPKATGCTCTSRGNPCQHALGLIFILLQNPDALAKGTPPPYLTEWLDKASLRARKQYERSLNREQSLHIPQGYKAQWQERKERVQSGLEELERWLINLIRHGLSDPRVKHYQFWDDIADRLVDAQAPGLAHWLRDIAGLPSRTDDWVQPLLEQLGRIYLVVESFKRFDALPIEAQYDLRRVIGWHLKSYEVDLQTKIRDHWFVIAVAEEKISDQLRAHRVWLRGQQTGREALLQEFAFGHAIYEYHYNSGSLIHAEIAYFPSKQPMQAHLIAQYEVESAEQALSGESIEQSISRYSAALARNPWIDAYAFVLDAVVPRQEAGQWIVQEQNGTYLPLSERFTQGWPLISLSGGHALWLSCEWDGSRLMPYGAMSQGRFVDLTRVGK